MEQDGRLHVSDSTVVLDKPGAISSRATVAQFRGCSKLLHVSIPATVSAIGAEAFMGCTGLRSVSWPRAPPDAHIGFGAFANCEALTKLILPDTLETIGAYAFANAMALTLVDIPDNVRHCHQRHRHQFSHWMGGRAGRGRGGQDQRGASSNSLNISDNQQSRSPANNDILIML